MPSRLFRTSLLLMAAAWLAPAAPARAEGRPAAAILKDYDAVEVPTFDREKAKEPGAVKAFREAYLKAQERRSALALELLRADPGNDRLPKLLIERWPGRMMDPATAGETIAEIDRALPHFKDKDEARTAEFMKTIASARKDPDHPESALPLIDAFIRKDPKDERGSFLLIGLSSEVQDPALKATLLKRLVAEFPDSRAAKSAKKAIELLEMVGKPLDLEFRDAIKGTTVSLKGLKGKVVVLDFWATWCGPCVEEMPKMKELYAKYRDRGVEFIGVSLDEPKEEGGLDKLKDFVAKNHIPWPQYYQGNGWESEFSSGLGIDAIPRVFLVDADGKIASVDARGKLDDLIPANLARAKAATEAK